MCVKIQQMHQLFIQFINYVWWLLRVSALHCHLQGAFLVPSERCSIEEQSIEYYAWAFNFFIMYVPFSVLFVCKCVLYCCHRVSNQLRLNIYHIISYQYEMCSVRTFISMSAR